MPSDFMNLRFSGAGIVPVADAFAGANKRSDVLNMEEHSEMVFIRYDGVTGGGTSTVTVNACDDTTPSNRTAIAFQTKTISTGSSGVTDTEGAWTSRSSSGFVSNGKTGEMLIIRVLAEDVAAAGGSYVELEMDEKTNAAVTGCVIAIHGGSRYPADTSTSVVS